MKRQKYYNEQIQKMKNIIGILIFIILNLCILIAYESRSLITYNELYNHTVSLKADYKEAIAEKEKLEYELQQVARYNDVLKANNYVAKVTIYTDVKYGTTPMFLFQKWFRNQKDIAYLEEYFIEYSIKYGIDMGYAAAVYVKEVGRHNNVFSWTNNNNPAGIKTFEGCRRQYDYCMYDTPKQGIEAMFKLLSKYYDGSMHGVKLRTVKQTRDKWSARKDEYEVVNIWNEMFKK